MVGEAVAWFRIQFDEEDPYGALKTLEKVSKLMYAGTHGSSIEVCGNEQFYLGRDTELW